MDHYSVIGPLLQLLPPEAAHRVAIRALSLNLPWPAAEADDEILNIALWNLRFSNPIGMAAGFDKGAEAYNGLLRLGFGFVEVGSITPQPQAGNPRPRLFRLPEDGAIINRLGFNSDGLAAAERRLRRRVPGRHGIVGINLGKNRDSPDAAADYFLGASRLAPFADYLVINVSSPNTPGLRALQEAAALTALIERVRGACAGRGAAPTPLLLKVAPDLTPEDRRDIAEVAIKTGIDGLIVGNTTISRPPHLKSRHAVEAGGLSGQPLFELSTDVLRDFYRLTAGRLSLVGVGGVSNGAEAYAKIRAGASLVQLYTALIYRGPALVARIKRDLAARLRADGFKGAAAAVGADHRPRIAT
jgi:dihydroorotate dehydrogenase